MRTIQNLFYPSRYTPANGCDTLDDAFYLCKMASAGDRNNLKKNNKNKTDQSILTLLLDDLLALARDQPNHWLCETCLALHPASRSDAPTRPDLSSCPQATKGPQDSLNDLIYYAFGHPSFRLAHRHVQLALKYDRLRKWRHRLHLRRLMADAHAPFTPNPRSKALAGDFSAYPKIVDGRFLVLSTWIFSQHAQPLSEAGIGSLRICRHQSFVGDPRLSPSSSHHADENHSDSDSDSGTHAVPNTILSRTIRSAFARPHHEICTACPRCPTDFSVQVTPDRALVRVWQDFGGDGSPLDPAWTVHVKSQTQTQTQTGERQKHKTGSIRERFGHCMREALYDIRNRREACESMGNVFVF